jgi:hypothetical protein
MRILARTLSALALGALVALVPAAGASAAKKPKAAAWAKKHDLKGAWRAKDADSDGLKNFAEYKQGTNPRQADSDKDGLKDGDEIASGNDPLNADTDDDGVKDGAEHAGVVTAIDGDAITIRQFKGPKLTATLDDCSDDVTAVDSSSDDWSDDEFVDTTEGDWEDLADEDPTAETSEDEDEVDLGDGDDSVTCDFSDLDVGSVLTSAELETRGGVQYLVTVEIA